MTASRDQFYNSLRLMIDLAGKRELIDIPANVEHSTAARILRNGLVVSSFSLLEQYLRDRLSELVPVLSQARIQYPHMPDRLRDFFVVDAIQGLVNQMSFLERNDKRAFVEQNIPFFSSILNTPGQYTSFGFAPRGSNIGFDDIKKLVGLFGVQGGWQLLGKISADVGMSRLDLGQDFKNFARDRNRAAHNITTNVPSADLISHLQTALLVGMSVDVIVTKSFAIFKSAKSTVALSNAIQNIILRSVMLDIQSDGKVREHYHGASRAIKIHTHLAHAKTQAKRRANVDYILVRDQRLFPIELA